ncbi:tetratricopeptide repeat protein [Armatimonas sp.]|uniref:tetratricopeptide repeat protein n=1 Tax=Armatimonas sp. TaxID=1872638 RepID=UPI00286BD72C|nr:tetratricopeptide repeat protein [Armatimonas sp.]
MNRFLFALPLTAALIGTVSAPTLTLARAQESRPELMKRAAALSEAKDWAASEKLYTQAIALDTKDAMGWLARGFVRSQSGNQDGAISDNTSGLTTLALADGTAHLRAIAYTNRGDAWRAKNEPLRALIDSLAACVSEEGFAAAWTVRADAQYLLGNLEQAKICIGKAQALDKSRTRTYTEEGARKNALGRRVIDEKVDIEPIFQAALTAEKSGDMEKAIAGYTEVIEIRPLASGAWGNRGGLHFKANRLEAAIADYSTAITVSSVGKQLDSMALDLTNRSLVYSRLGRLAETVNDLELAVKVKPNYTRAVDLLKTARETLAAAPSEALPPLERAQKYFLQAEKAGLFEAATPRNAARKILDELIAAEPKNAAALVLRGKLANLGMIGVVKEAREFFDRALAADPNNADALYEHAVALNSGFSVSDSDRAQALKELKLAVTKGKNDAKARLKLADALSEARDLSGAGEQMDLVIKAEPQNEDYLRKRAVLRQQQKDWGKAITDWSQVITLKPTPGNYASRGDAYVENRQFTEAITDFDRAIALAPKDADQLVGRARAKRLKGDKSGALADYTKAHELDATLPAVAANLSDADKADAARHDFKRLMGKLTNSSNQLNETLGELNKAQRAKDKAEARLRRLLMGDKRTDTEILADFESDSKANVLDEEDYLSRARVFARQEKLDSAIADCTKALALKSDYHEAYNWRGICYETKKDFEKAFADYDKAVSLRPTFSAYLRNRGDIHYELKRFNEAWTDYDKAVTNEPKEATNYFKRGNASFQRSKYDDAIVDYTKALELKPDMKAAADNREVARKKKG